MQILLPEAYISFPSLGKPVINNMAPEKPPRYKATFIFPKGTDLSQLNTEINKIVAEVFGGKSPKNLPVKPCDQKIDKDTGLVLPLYDKGDFFCNPWSSEDNPVQLLGP